MDGTHLIDALAIVIAKYTGRTPERVLAALSRDVNDPAVWRAHEQLNPKIDDPEEYRLRWQRLQTRRSRLVTRLCEELVTTATGAVHADASLGTSLSFFQQLSSAIILHQHGHMQAGGALVRRALLRAASAGESAYAVLAADMLVAMQVRTDDERSQVRFDTERHRWREVDHRRRIAEEQLIRCLEYRRHICDRSKALELEQALVELHANAMDPADPTFSIYITALTIQQHLVHRENREAIMLLDSVAENLKKLPSQLRWVGQWLMVARLKAHLAVGEYATVLRIPKGMKHEDVQRGYLQCDIVRLRSIAAMRHGQWEQARQLILQGMMLISESTDRLDQQRQMLIVAYYNLGAALGYHSEPVPISTKRISSLMNSVDLVLQDKAGLAPIMLVYEVTANLLQGKLELAERKMANLQVYSTRNLRFHGATALRAFISLLRMIVNHDGAFTNDARRVRLFMSRITDEHEHATEQMICPLPLRKLAQSLIDLTNGRLRQTSV